MRTAQRLDLIPPYLFAEIRRKIAVAKSRGIDVITLGIADPDLPTPDHIVDEMVRALRDAADPDRHRYGGDCPVGDYLDTVAGWYKREFDVEIDPRSEVLLLMGSKDGIAHMPWAMIDPGVVALVPEPGYTVYNVGTLFAGGEVHFMPLREENSFLPDLSAIPAEVARRARLMWLNYPNNPTGAVASLEFFTSVVEFARKYDILVCHDAPYSSNTFDGYKAPSILQVPGAKDVCVELNSLSKRYNMTGWRIGFAVGQPDAIKALSLVKDNVDSGVLRPIQFAAIKALEGSQECVARTNEIYRRRRDLVIDALNSMGWNLKKPLATFLVWAPLPTGYTSSIEFASMLLEQAGVVVTPGVGYGPSGEGYFRVSLTYPEPVLCEAMDRMRAALSA